MVFSNLEYCYIPSFHVQLGKGFLIRLPRDVSDLWNI